MGQRVLRFAALFSMCETIVRLAGLGLAMALMCRAQAPVPFAEFIEHVRHADARDFLRKPGAEVKDAAEFEHMREYLLKLYAGVHARRSYLAGSQTIDCIPANEQPAMRGQGKDVATPPPSAGDQGVAAGACGPGTIPMRRITIKELTTFPTLDDYLRKAPGGGRVPAPRPKGA